MRVTNAPSSVRASVRPVSGLQAISLCERGTMEPARAMAIFAGVPGDVAKQELAALAALLAPDFGEIEQQICGLSFREGPKSALLF